MVVLRLVVGFTVKDCVLDILLIHLDSVKVDRVCLDTPWKSRETDIDRPSLSG
jgi:hypothetical protein